MAWKNLNDEGCIPAETDCPYSHECLEAEKGDCHHLGKEHNQPFSCKKARGYDVIAQCFAP